MNNESIAPNTQQDRIPTGTQQQRNPRNRTRGGPRSTPFLKPDPMAEFHAALLHDARPRSTVLGEHLSYDRAVQGMIYTFQPTTSAAFECIALRAKTLVDIRRLDRAIDALASSEMGRRGPEVYAPDELAAWSAVEQSVGKSPAWVGRRIDDIKTLQVVAQQVCMCALPWKEAEQAKAAARKAKKEARAAARRAQKGAAAVPTEPSQSHHAPQKPKSPPDILSLFGIHLDESAAVPTEASQSNLTPQKPESPPDFLSLINSRPDEFDEFTSESFVFSMLRGKRLVSIVQRQMWTCLVPYLCKAGRRRTEESTGPGLPGSDRAALLQVGMNLRDNSAQAGSLLRQRTALINCEADLLRRLMELCESSASWPDSSGTGDFSDAPEPPETASHGFPRAS